jgi:hypothetical protein
MALNPDRDRTDGPVETTVTTETVRTTTPVDTVPVYTETPPPRASSSRVVLYGLLAFLLVGGALAAWRFLQPNPAAEVDAGAPVAMAPPPATARVEAPKTAVVPPAEPGRRVRPADAGIVPEGATAPALKPAEPGGAPRMVPVKGIPTPVQPPEGLAGTPGKRVGRSTVVVTKPAAIQLSPAVQNQLKQLWEQGAAAKQSGNYVEARRAWQKMLQLNPGHPGVQQAIDQLPNS